MRHLIFIALALGLMGPAMLRADIAPSVEACRTARAEAWEALRQDYFSAAAPKFALEEFLRIADECSAASEKATSSLTSAYLAAESAICRAIYERFDGSRNENRRPEVEKRQLRRGIQMVIELDGEQSPALLELLDRLVILEWTDEPGEAVRLLEQRIEITRQEYGATDPRYVEALMTAAQMYEPSYMGGEREIIGADDPKAAERHYLAALKALAKEPILEGSKAYRELLWSMRLFYEGEGRDREAADLEQAWEEVRLEIRIEEELPDPMEDPGPNG